MKNYAVNVVLVRTLYDSNIGASSRAMANMGASRLILIGPQCEISYSAQQAAASGQAALQNRVTYRDWDEFFASEPDGIRLSLTARDGKGRQVRDLAAALKWIAKEDPRLQKKPDASSGAAAASGGGADADALAGAIARGGADEALPLYLIFGPEDWGLSAEDLSLTHFACSIPTYGDNTSLNLAQAVLLALFILRETWGGTRAILEGQQPPRKKRENPTVFPAESLRVWLEEMGFDTSDRRISAYTVLKRMLLHNIPSGKELNILETVLQQGIRKLREYNELREKMGLPSISPSNSDKK
jgi:tRNA/rRNA methyltransferase